MKVAEIVSVPDSPIVLSGVRLVPVVYIVGSVTEPLYQVSTPAAETGVDAMERTIAQIKASTVRNRIDFFVAVIKNSLLS